MNVIYSEQKQHVMNMLDQGHSSKYFHTHHLFVQNYAKILENYAK